MNDIEAANFFNKISKLDESVENLEDAIIYALENVPLVKSGVYFGEIEDEQGKLIGVYYGDSSESRWFTDMTKGEVAGLLAMEMI